MMSTIHQDVETSCKSFMVEMMFNNIKLKDKSGKGEYLKVIIWLNYGFRSEGAGLELEALFVMKDVCIMK